MKLKGGDCIASNVILQFNKLRYKDGKGCPREFIVFLENHDLHRGLIPRYRGNRLHVMFHIAGVLVELHDKFVKFLRSGTSLGGLRALLLADYTSTPGKVELHVLGLIGKHLSGPWMKTFYTSASDETGHVEGISIIKNVIAALKELQEDPKQILVMKNDFFGNQLDVNNTLQKLRSVEASNLFEKCFHNCVKAIIDVLERQ